MPNNSPEKILILNGSPKCKSSLTLKVTEAFVKGMQSERNCTAEYIHVSEKNIRPCTGCLSCWGRTEGECVIKDDDMPFIRDSILSSDYIIESFPIYFFGMPGTLKVMTDRLLGIMCTFSGEEIDPIKTERHALRSPKEGQRLALITSCGFSESADVFEPIKKQYDLVFGADRYSHFCVPQLKALAQAGSGQRFSKMLALAEQAGAEFITTGKIDPALTAELSSPILSQKTYRVLMEKFWRDEKDEVKE